MNDPRWKFTEEPGRCAGCGAEFRRNATVAVVGEKTYSLHGWDAKCAVDAVVAAFLAECYAEEGGFGQEQRDALAERFPSAAHRRFEIENPYGRILKVDPWIFRSWNGKRFVDGEPYEGPVYGIGSWVLS